MTLLLNECPHLSPNLSTSHPGVLSPSEDRVLNMPARFPSDSAVDSIPSTAFRRGTQTTVLQLLCHPGISCSCWACMFDPQGSLRQIRSILSEMAQEAARDRLKSRAINIETRNLAQKLEETNRERRDFLGLTIWDGRWIRSSTCKGFPSQIQA
jgi:hypothetical protein